MTSQEKQTKFHKELKQLLKKFDAEIIIEDFGTGHHIDEKIVIEFNYDDRLDDMLPVPDLILGTYEDGNQSTKP